MCSAGKERLVIFPRASLRASLPQRSLGIHTNTSLTPVCVHTHTHALTHTHTHTSPSHLPQDKRPLHTGGGFLCDSFARQYIFFRTLVFVMITSTQKVNITQIQSNFLKHNKHN